MVIDQPSGHKSTPNKMQVALSLIGRFLRQERMIKNYSCYITYGVRRCNLSNLMKVVRHQKMHENFHLAIASFAIAARSVNTTCLLGNEGC